MTSKLIILYVTVRQQNTAQKHAKVDNGTNPKASESYCLRVASESLPKRGTTKEFHGIPLNCL